MLLNKLPSMVFRPVVIVPTFNNAGTLPDVLGRIGKLGVSVIVVNDGSTDATGEVLKQFQSITVLAHPSNQGKAAALRTGFAAAARAGFTHALTIDADGQHDPEQIPALLARAEEKPNALVLGYRDEHAAGYPFFSRFGRRFSNRMVWFESGLNLRDSQSGMRVYPLEFVNSTPCDAGRYGFETEILTRAGWVGRAIEEVEINCRYLPRESRVSHFRPIVDSARSLKMHARLLRQAPSWNPKRAWREMRERPESRKQFAAGLALGVFVACLPIYGLQGVVSLIAARLMKMNPLSALAGSQLSMPPLSAVLIFVSIAAGHFVLHGSWPDPSWWRMIHSAHFLSLLRMFLAEWIVGGTLIGIVLAGLSYTIVRAVLGRGMPAAGSAGQSA